MRFQSYNDQNINDLNSILNSGDHIFILVYMDGCMPCNLMKPNWYNLKDVMQDQYDKRNDIAIVDVEKNYLPQLTSVGDVEGFPTIKYINTSKGDKESYDGPGDTDNLVKWIESKIDHVNTPINVNEGQLSIEDIENSNKNSTSSLKTTSKKSSKKSTQKGGKRRRKNKRNTKKRRKWSLKYKRSINCKRPKGFSQKQYCKYKK
jgi:hypothetical protein